MEAKSPISGDLPNNFVLYWTLATSVGFILSYAIYATSVVMLWLIAGIISPSLFSSLPPDEANLRLALYLAPIAIPLLLVTCLPPSVAQWLVLRGTTLNTRFWIPATTLGLFIGIAVPLLTFASLGPTIQEWPAIVATASFALFLGAATGTAQWLTLRNRLNRSISWIPLSAIAMVACIVPLFLFEGTALESIHLLVVPTAPAFFAFVTGRFLRHLASRSLQSGSRAPH